MLKKKKTKKGLAAKLKNYMEDVTIDVFGYEEKITENVTRYLGTVSDTDRIPLGNITIRIALSAGQLEVTLHDLDTLTRKVALPELVDFFMGAGSTGVFNWEEKIDRSVTGYLTDFSTRKGLPLQGLNIRISKPHEKVVVMAYHQAEWIEQVPLKQLIKHFKG